MFHYFTIKFHFSFSLLFASFCCKFFASLHFGNFCFEVKQSEAKPSIFFRFFHFFLLFSAFSRFFSLSIFRFQFFASLRFSNFCFEAKQSEAKFKSIFSLLSLFFTFFHFFSLFSLFSLFFFAFFTFFRFFSLNFRFTSIFSLNFCLFYLPFRFRFLVFHIEVNHVKSGFFFASKRNEIFASISNFASEAKVRAHSSLDKCNTCSQFVCVVTCMGQIVQVMFMAMLTILLTSHLVYTEWW